MATSNTKIRRHKLRFPYRNDNLTNVELDNMRNTLILSKPIFISLIMVLSTTLVPGCLDGTTEEEETGVNATAPATPREAMGLWLPTIDGHIGQQSELCMESGWILTDKTSS